ncbi:FixH family protein [Lysobacter yangpyeongensis]|uniref:FixH family protein n=1 Tax=Lysobacter yangpyeongensis TaxID=346182 RepID=A0ABW0SJ68_9GAMM
MMTLDNRVKGTERRSAWREPMVWLIAAIPAAAVIATIALLVTASRSPGTDDAVADRVTRTAQVQVADLGPDAKARQLHLSAIVRTGKGTVEVLPVDGAFDRAAPLLLSLHHPSRAELDRDIHLAASKTSWRAQADVDLSHDWNVQLGPDDGAWRLQGRWAAKQQAAYLHPAVGGN